MQKSSDHLFPISTTPDGTNVQIATENSLCALSVRFIQSWFLAQPLRGYATSSYKNLAVRSELASLFWDDSVPVHLKGSGLESFKQVEVV